MVASTEQPESRSPTATLVGMEKVLQAYVNTKSFRLDFYRDADDHHWDDVLEHVCTDQ